MYSQSHREKPPRLLWDLDKSYEAPTYVHGRQLDRRSSSIQPASRGLSSRTEANDECREQEQRPASCAALARRHRRSLVKLSASEG